MKPQPAQAMQGLIDKIRAAIPFDTPEASLCVGPCQGCSKKLIEFLDSELKQWQLKLSQGESPTLGELEKLGRCAKKIHKVLIKNGIIFDQTVQN